MYNGGQLYFIMIDIRIKNCFCDITLYLGRVKLLAIDDYNAQTSIVKTFNTYFNKEKDSEYAIEKGYSSLLLSDNKKININDYDYFYITNEYDLYNDLKLGTKSLLLKYLDYIIDELIFSEEYQTFKIVWEDLMSKISFILNKSSSDLIINVNSEIEKKQILKILSLNIFKDDLKTNVNDLSYDEKIIFQLNIVKALLKKSNRKAIILVDLQYISSVIMKSIDDIYNAFSILITNKIDKDIHIDPMDVFLWDKQVKVDLYDDNVLNEMIFESDQNYSIEQYRAKLMEKVLKKISN